jgi:hypothetical protein
MSAQSWATCPLRSRWKLRSDEVPQAVDHHGLIITLVARHKLPAIYFERYFVTAGGLISYDPNFDDEGRRAAP